MTTYIAKTPSIFQGMNVGTHQCVAYVQSAAKVPNTAQWKVGAKVQGDTTIPTGTAIASFDPDGTYGNHTDGRSHAAIYIGQSDEGIYVWDQWVGQPVHLRIIRYYPVGGTVTNVNNGCCFSVIETA